MMQLNDLPQFMQDELKSLPDDVRNAILNSLTPEMVACKIAGHEIVKGLDEGKWTTEDLKNEIDKHRLPH